MADETPTIPETTQEPVETINTTALTGDLTQEKQNVQEIQHASEPMIQDEAAGTSVSAAESSCASQESHAGAKIILEQEGAASMVTQELVSAETPSETGPLAVEIPPVKKINIFVKTPQEKESFEIEENAGVRDFKQLIAPKFNAEPDQLVLIFAGKIMDDSDTMQQHKVKEGLTIHLVIRVPETGPPRQSADVSATPYSLGNLGGLVGLAQLGMGSPNFMELQNQMQNELLTNPNVLRNLLENPLVQELMTNTDVLRTLIMRNPQMQELIDR